MGTPHNVGIISTKTKEKKMTKNFQISEFECKGNLKGCECKMTANVKNNLLKLAEQLQILRDYLGVPIKINSGFRCADYNDNHINGVNFLLLLGMDNELDVLLSLMMLEIHVFDKSCKDS